MIMFNEYEKKLTKEFDDVNKICEENSIKVLNAFHDNEISDVHFFESTGYGYNDLGRDKIEEVFKNIFKCEDALVRSQFISGTQAITTCFFGVLRPNDTMMYITGEPYDTLHKVIGIVPNNSSLKSFNVNYKQIDLIENNFDYDSIKEELNNVKMVCIQRSIGYSNRKTISIEQCEKVISFIKNINKDIIVFVDNCYCEFVTLKEPTEVGADIVAGSLIKNLGGGIASNGGYVCGKSKYIELIAERLTVPGQGKEVGPSLGNNKKILQGLYMAPSAVASSLKTAILASYILDSKGYEVEPKYNEKRYDIVQKIIFKDPNKLIKFVQGIQKGSAIDSNALTIPDDMPGYDDKIIMASGSFTQGSSIELSCDGPLREPYIAYLQGSLTYEYGKIGIKTAIDNLD